MDVKQCSFDRSYIALGIFLYLRPFKTFAHISLNDYCNWVVEYHNCIQIDRDLYIRCDTHNHRTLVIVACLDILWYAKICKCLSSYQLKIWRMVGSRTRLKHEHYA